MKKILIGLLAVLFLSASTVYAVPYGEEDIIIDWANGITSDADQLKFILGTDDITGYSLFKYEFADKDEFGNEIVDPAWINVEENLWAFDFYQVYEGYAPEKFVIKTGANVIYDDATYDVFLYENLDSLRYGLINLDVFDRSKGNVEIQMVSHISSTAQVPEPTTMLLLGVGLLGLISVGRRKFTK